MPRSHDLSSSIAYEDDTPAPPAWKRKLVPRVGKGLIPTKTYVIHIAPDGEEIKSKTQLQRYLKARTDGPAVSEFNWSPGETQRRSARLTARTPTKTMDVNAAPKSNKRKSLAIPLEESNVLQPISSPLSKRTKKTGKDVLLKRKDASGALADSASASVVEGEESMKEVRNKAGNFFSDEAAAKPVATDGDVQVSRKDEKVEDAKDKYAEKGVSFPVSDKEPLRSVNGKDSEPFVPISSNSEDLHGVSETIANGKRELTAAMPKDGELLETPNFKSTKHKSDESQSKAAEEEGQGRVLNEAKYQAEEASVAGTAQDYENGSVQEGKDPVVPAGASS